MSALLPTYDLFDEAVTRRARETERWAHRRDDLRHARAAAARTKEPSHMTARLTKVAHAIEAAILLPVRHRDSKPVPRTHG